MVRLSTKPPNPKVEMNLKEPPITGAGAGAGAAASPPAPSTLRRNPPRSARPPPTPLPNSKPSQISRLLEEAAERLKVFLRIRPLPLPERKGKAKSPTNPKQVCLVANSPNSVALTVPHSKLLDPKRGRTEVFDGFSSVFSPDSSQYDVFSQVMNPLVDDLLLGGKSGLLVAMGPTGSGKTHTVFGSPRNPGLVPLTLRRIFSSTTHEPCSKLRSFCFSMFEILSEGKGERILDLLSDATDLVLQQSTIKGLKEVSVENFADAEALLLSGMLKRTTAATNANSNRSQCIITIRAVHKRSDAESENSLNNAVLTIADLAGAERERRTGNQGTRLLESNFINNTSMVFGLCLRSLLEHQKNKKKPLEKHFKNSMLTRYLRDYLEGRKKMTLILNVAGKDDIDKDDGVTISEKDESQYKLLNSELRRVSRNEEIMTNFARALWTVLKQYKQKLLESENAVESTRELLRSKDIKIMELEKKLKVLSCSCKKFPAVEDTFVEQNNDVSSGQVAQSFVSLSSQTDLVSIDSALNKSLAVEEVSEESTGHGPERSSDYDDKTGTGGSDVCDTSIIKLIAEEELCSGDCKVLDKKLDRSESCSDGGGVTHSSSSLDHPSDQSFTDTCLQNESANLSPQFIGASKKSPIEQSEEEREEIHNITTEGIQQNVHTRGVKHHSTPSCSQEVNSGSLHVSSSQLQGMGALQQDPQSERCKPTVGITIVEYGCAQPPHVVDDHGGMYPCTLNGKSSPRKAPISPTKDNQAEKLTDKIEDLSASKPCNRKNTRRRLQPVSAMMLKEFTGPDIFVDTRKEEKVKSSRDAMGRSDKLIRLLTDHPPRARGRAQ
uniref:Kinesin motor domain-containing protein n=1 Tax=Oryza glumipatula TaxID=40148 RepID=A0A0D9YKZ4_9ORYZ